MSSNIFIDFLILAGAYILGSIPFGILFSWLFKLKDPRTVGSKNIGATNILRSGHRGAAFLTLFFDILKGGIAVLLVLWIKPGLAPWAGIFVVIGHIWPLWLFFRGGKGVATAFGVIFILSWPIAILCLFTWLGIAFFTRYSSLAALIGMALSSFYAWYLNKENLLPMCLILTIFILWSHRHNIKRLLIGKETKIGHTCSLPPSPL